MTAVDFKKTCIVLYAGQYSMETAAKEHVEGVTVCYLGTDSLEPVENLEAKARGNFQLGEKPAKESVPYSLSKDFVRLPGLYELGMTMKMVTAANGQTVPN